MSGIRTKQTVVIGALVLLVGFLFTRDVKGLVTPKENAEKGAPAMPVADETVLNMDQVTTGARNTVSREKAAEVKVLEEAYNNATGNKKVEAAKALSDKWDALEQYVPGALYYEEAAKIEGSLNNWLKTGNKFITAFQSTQDAELQTALLTRANSAYKAVLAIDSNNVDAKTGVGITIVNGLGMPMEGITMLLEVVKNHPDNTNALMQLGMFSMRSGQFDKAVGRFNQVIALKPTSEAYFYLGTSYESLNKKTEAVAAYTQSKRISANPTFSAFIDKKVAELKK